MNWQKNFVPSGWNLPSLSCADTVVLQLCIITSLNVVRERGKNNPQKEKSAGEVLGISSFTLLVGIWWNYPCKFWVQNKRGGRVHYSSQYALLNVFWVLDYSKVHARFLDEGETCFKWLFVVSWAGEVKLWPARKLLPPDTRSLLVWFGVIWWYWSDQPYYMGGCVRVKVPCKAGCFSLTRPFGLISNMETSLPVCRGHSQQPCMEAGCQPLAA